MAGPLRPSSGPVGQGRPRHEQRPEQPRDGGGGRGPGGAGPGLEVGEAGRRRGPRGHRAQLREPRGGGGGLGQRHRGQLPLLRGLRPAHPGQRAHRYQA